MAWPLAINCTERSTAIPDEKLANARVVVEDDAEMAPLPDGWGKTLTTEPLPNVAAAVRRSRDSH